jgi:superfamily II DNA or RNA helicase
LITIYKINESFIKLEGYSYDQGQQISDEFSYRVNGFQFMRLYKEGFWDGRIRLFSAHTGKMNIGLLYKLKKYLKKCKIPFKVSKALRLIDMSKYSKDFIENYFDDTINWDYSLRPDQTNAIYNALKYNKMVIESPTGSGKSLMLFMIEEMLKDYDANSKTLLIVPRSGLVEQMRSDFIDYAKNYTDYDENLHMIYSGKEKDTDKNLIISTWQSLQNMPVKYFHQFDNLIIDEAHGINQKSKEVKKIVENCINAPFKIGDTGTVDDMELNKMLLEGLFGPIYKVSSTQDLIKKGILSTLDIKMILLNYSDQDRKKCANFRDISTSLKGRKKYRPMNYHEEVQFIRDSDLRLDKIIQLVKDINKEQNTLILFKSLEYGKKIYERLCNETNKKVFYIAGATNVTVREEVRKYSENNSNIVIVASAGVFSVGINIKKLHNIMIVSSIKSKIRLLQSIGRSLRIHDTKEVATLIDIVDNLTWNKRKNYTMEHCLERIKIYDREKFKYNVKEINL